MGGEKCQEEELVTAEGLRPVKEVGMYGKIAVMELFRPKVSALGWLGPATKGELLVVVEFMLFYVIARLGWPRRE